MSRLIGTTAHGIRLPIIKEGDDLVKIVSDCFMEVVKDENIDVKNTDIIGITESLLARAQGNYVSLDNIVEDLTSKFLSDEISLVHPILSRNRFLNILKAISMTGKKVKIYLSYPDDEVGNLLMDRYEIMKKDINVYKDTLTEEDYIRILGKKYLHPFTGLDYTSIYKSVFEEGQVEVLYSNNFDDIAENAKSILVANIHDRDFLKELFKSKGIEETYTLADIMSAPIGDSGYNENYGLYGSNFSSDNSLKLFPRDAKKFVNDVQAEILKRSGKKVEVLIYGDGAFKDPIGRIWELADPTSFGVYVLLTPSFSKVIRIGSILFFTELGTIHSILCPSFSFVPTKKSSCLKTSCSSVSSFEKKSPKFVPNASSTSDNVSIEGEFKSRSNCEIYPFVSSDLSANSSWVNFIFFLNLLIFSPICT